MRRTLVVAVSLTIAIVAAWYPTGGFASSTNPLVDCGDLLRSVEDPFPFFCQISDDVSPYGLEGANGSDSDNERYGARFIQFIIEDLQIAIGSFHGYPLM